jgi:hypothetical protein
VKGLTKLPDPAPASKSTSVSNAVLASRVDPDFIDQLQLLNIPDFEELGYAIAETIADYYELKPSSRAFSSRLKSMDNWKINTAIMALRMLPFRFDSSCRKLLDCINSGVNLKQNINKVAELIGLKCPNIEPLNFKIEAKTDQNKADLRRSLSQRKKSLSVNKDEKSRNIRVTNAKKQDGTEDNPSLKTLGTAMKIEKCLEKIPDLPKPPQRKSVVPKIV